MIKEQKTTYLHLPKKQMNYKIEMQLLRLLDQENVTSVVAAIVVTIGDHENVTVTVGRWKVSLLQDHENVTATVVALLYYNCCNCNYCNC